MIITAKLAQALSNLINTVNDMYSETSKGGVLIKEILLDRDVALELYDVDIPEGVKILYSEDHDSYVLEFLDTEEGDR